MLDFVFLVYIITSAEMTLRSKHGLCTPRIQPTRFYQIIILAVLSSQFLKNLKDIFSYNLNSHKNDHFSKIIKKSIIYFVLKLEIYFRVYFFINWSVGVFFRGGGGRGLGYFSCSQYLARYSYHLQELNVRLKFKEMRPSLCQVP